MVTIVEIQCVMLGVTFMKGYFQEIHIHPDCDFAAAMMLNSGPNFARFFLPIE